MIFSIFIFFFSLKIFCSSIIKDESDDKSLGFISMVIFPDENVPNYYDTSNTVTISDQECLTDSNFLPIYLRLPESLLEFLKTFLDDSDRKNLISSSLVCFKNYYNINNLNGLSLNDQSIFLASLFNKIFFISYPGLRNREIYPADRICLIMLACVVSGECKIKYNKIEYLDSQVISHLKKAFLSLDIFKRKPLLESHTLDSIFSTVSSFSSFLLAVQKNHTISYTLEAISRLLKLPKITNKLYNLKQMPLTRFYISSFGISKDQTIFNNHLNNFSHDQLVKCQIGRLHVLHLIISNGGIYCADLYGLPEISQVALDAQTKLSFYSATLFYAIKHKNYSILKGILEVADDKFIEFDPNKIDSNYRNPLIKATENRTETDFINQLPTNDVEILASLK